MTIVIEACSYFTKIAPIIDIFLNNLLSINWKQDHTPKFWSNQAAKRTLDDLAELYLL